MLARARRSYRQQVAARPFRRLRAAPHDVGASERSRARNCRRQSVGGRELGTGSGTLLTVVCAAHSTNSHMRRRRRRHFRAGVLRCSARCIRLRKPTRGRGNAGRSRSRTTPRRPDQLATERSERAGGLRDDCSEPPASLHAAVARTGAIERAAVLSTQPDRRAPGLNESSSRRVDIQGAGEATRIEGQGERPRCLALR